MIEQQRQQRAAFMREQPGLWLFLLYARVFLSCAVASDVWVSGAASAQQPPERDPAENKLWELFTASPIRASAGENYLQISRRFSRLTLKPCMRNKSRSRLMF